MGASAIVGGIGAAAAVAGTASQMAASSGGGGDSGYSDAAAIIAQAMRKAEAAQKAGYAQSLEAIYPWMATGKQALGMYGSLLGMDMGGLTYPNSFALDASSPLYAGGPMGPAPAPGKMGARYGGENAFGGAPTGTGTGGAIWPGMNTGNLTDYIRQTPGYQFQLSEGMNALEKYAAAKGQTLSGAHLRGITDYGQNTADKYFNQYMQQLAGLSGSGQAAATGSGTNAMAVGANLGQTAMGGAQGMAQAAIGGAQADAAASQNQFNNLLTGGIMGGYGANKLYNSFYAGTPATGGSMYSNYDIPGLWGP